MQGNQKFLVRLLHDVSHTQMFFLLWTAIVILFVGLIFGYQKKMSRRNFRGEEDTPKKGNALAVNPSERLPKDHS